MARASIGLGAFMQKLTRPMYRRILMAPSSRAVLQERVLPLSNSVMISNDLPCEIRIEQILEVPLAIEASVRDRILQNAHVSTYGLANLYGLNDPHKDSHKHEKNLIAQTVQQEITLALSLLVEEKAASVADIATTAAIPRKDLWYQINGRMDFQMNGLGILPATSTEPKFVDNPAHANKFDKWSNDVMDGYVIPPEGISTFQTRRPYFSSGFDLSEAGSHVCFPAINLCIDNKTDMKKQDGLHKLRDNYIAQCGLYLLSSSVAYAQFTAHDQPFMTLGIVTDGKAFTFLAFQLNTLDFDSKSTRNFFWQKNMELFDEHQKFDSATWAQFKKILAYSLRKTLQ